MHYCDLNSNGQIEFSEWLVATTCKNIVLNVDKLKLAFQYFNKAGDGKISMNELKEVMGCNGITENRNANLDDQVFKDIIAEVDDDEDGFIDFRDFKKMMDKLAGHR